MNRNTNPRLRFMDRFLENELTPAEELFALCNAYRYSKGLRMAAAYADTDTLQRHTLGEGFRVGYTAVKTAFFNYQKLKRRPTQGFGTRLREFIYNALRYAKSFPGVNQETFKPHHLNQIAA